MRDIVRITRALFAARKHVHHRRKGLLAEPYINLTCNSPWLATGIGAGRA